MEATKLIVEYLVSGILVILALVLIAVSFLSPDGLEITAQSVIDSLPSAELIPASIAFAALAYGLGIIAEYVGDKSLDWRLDRIKIKRIKEYIREHLPRLEKDPILGRFTTYAAEWEKEAKSGQKPKALDKQLKKELKDCHGRMRFWVMHHSPQLYSEISAQINRFRLIRVLIMVEVLIAIALVRQLFRGFEWVWFVTLLLIAALGAAGWFAVRSRYNRYCRAAERSYFVLLLDQEKNAAD